MLGRIIGTAMILCLMAGCAATGPKLGEAKASFPALAADQGRIYFYRGTSIFGAAITADIRLNGAVVGRSTRGSFFFVDRAAGNFEAAASTETEKKVTFTLAAGETKYIRTSVGLGVLVGRVILELVNPDVAEKEMTELAYTPAK